MPSSPARVAANRANSLRSTGPRTAEGKERSRCNAVKHGLTGAGVALPIEDVAVVEGRFAALRDELEPRTVLGSILVKRVAMLSVRLDRSGRQESASLAGRVGRAGIDFDEARMEEVGRLLDLLGDDPITAIRNLRRMPEGVDRLIQAWAGLLEDLTIDAASLWNSEHSRAAERLDGRHHERLGYSRINALHLASHGSYLSLLPGDGDGLDDGGRRAWARAQLVEIVDARLAELRAHRASLDPAPIAEDRARAADRALFDPSKDAVLARKYEAAAERALFRTLKEFREVEAAAADPETEAESVPTEKAEAEPVASFSPARFEAPSTPDGPVAPGRSGPVHPPSNRVVACLTT